MLIICRIHKDIALKPSFKLESLVILKTHIRYNDYLMAAEIHIQCK